MFSGGNRRPLTRYQAVILSVGILVVTLCVIVVWLLSPSLAVSIAGGLVAALLLAVLGWIWRLVPAPRIWPNRNSVRPSLQSRMDRAQTSLFLVGFSFGWTTHEARETLVQALNTNRNMRVRMLMLHPGSLHANAHEPFSTQPISERFARTERFLLDLLSALTEDAKRRFQVRTTHYLPRFAARVFDDSTMLLNFYLYGAAASQNPMIELRRDLHRQSFKGILASLDQLFDYDADEPSQNKYPNHKAIENGRWNGLS